MHFKSPPCVSVKRDISSTPEEQWYVEEDRGEQREPQPEILPGELVLAVLTPYETPILLNVSQPVKRVCMTTEGCVQV
jgi:hypothetical protein